MGTGRHEKTLLVRKMTCQNERKMIWDRQINFRKRTKTWAVPVAQ